MLLILNEPKMKNRYQPCTGSSMGSSISHKAVVLLHMQGRRNDWYLVWLFDLSNR